MHSGNHEQVAALWDSDLEQVNTAILVTMDQQNGQQLELAIKMFYKNSEFGSCTEGVLMFLQLRPSWCHSIKTRDKKLD